MSFKKLHRISSFTKKISVPISLAHALGLEIENLTDEKKNLLTNGSLTTQNKVLTYQYKLPPMTIGKEQRTQRKQCFPLSGFLATLDEYTTWDLILNDRKGRFGVSTSLECEIGPDFQNDYSIVELRARVEKIGKVLGFVSAEVINIETGKVICYARHSKYMSTPYDFIFVEPIHSIVNFFLPFFVKKKTHYLNDNNDQFLPSLDDIFNDKNIFHLGNSDGKIILGNWQTNGLGGLHGGAQAILMEQVGYEFLNASNDNNIQIILQSMSVSFMSATKITSILFHVSIINQDNTSATMKVQLKNNSGSTTISEGILRWKKEFL